MTVTRQRQEVTTVQAEVGPGDVTGVYYIAVCNLPFQTSWQQLKDWLRPHCEVDHVEVFQSSTSGWVRLLGRDNFDKAWVLLNGGVFQGRSIIASDRNRSEAMKIREVIDAGASHAHRLEHTGSSDRTMTQPDPSAVQSRVSENSGTRYISSAVPELGSSAGSPTMVDNASFPRYMAPSTLTTGLPSGFLMANPAPQAQFQGSQYEDINAINAIRNGAALRRARAMIQAQVAAVRSRNVQQVHAADAQSEQTQSMLVQDTASGDFQILLKSIHHRYQIREVGEWVRGKLGSLRHRLVGIELPADCTRALNCGRAILRFEHGTQCSQVIEKLHQQVFRGRKLIASPFICQFIYRQGDFITSTGAPGGGEYPWGLSGGISSDTFSDSLPSMPSNNGPLVVGGSTHRYPTGLGY